MVSEPPDGSEEQFSDIFAGIRRPRPRLRGRRSHIEMMADVLDAIRNGADKPTRVMYKSNLSWSVCQDLLKHLAAKGLLETRAGGERRVIVLTPRGSLALSEYCRAVEEISD
ncbi:MAG: hypothetical protein JRN45_11225 [Nitrososphaerota archaeon]|nr:hypothetical protein [Nitrososphaerota archaeon]